MKLVFLNHNVIDTGTFFRAFHVARHLVQRGHEVTVITTSRTARAGVQRHTRAGVAITEMPDLMRGAARSGIDPWNTLQRMRAVAPERCDLLYAFDSRPAVILPALHMKRRRRLPMVMDWADWWGRGGTIQDRSSALVKATVGRVETWFEEHFRTDADATTVISTALQQRAIGLGVPADSILHFPMGCDIPTGLPTRAQARERLGVGSDKRIVLHLGVAVQKDATLLFDAFRIAHQQDARIQLVLVGNFRTPTPADLSVSVVRTGVVSNDTLRDWLAAADACVIPLRDTIANRGRWPSKINDYLASGRRILVTGVGDAAPYVASHGAGQVTAPSPAGLADGMLTLLAQSSGAAAAGEAAALDLARGELSWRTIMDRVEPFLQHACAHD